MPEPGQAPAGTDPIVPPVTDPPIVPPAGGAGSGQDPDRDKDRDKDKDKNESELRRARDEAAKYRVEKAELAAELKKIKDAQLTDAERQANRVKELEAEVAKNQADGRLKDVQVALAVAGARKPELVARLIPDDAKDITKAVEAFKKDNPEFFGVTPPRPGGVDAGAGGGADSGGELHGMNAVIRRAAGR